MREFGARSATAMGAGLQRNLQLFVGSWVWALMVSGNYSFAVSYTFE